MSERPPKGPSVRPYLYHDEPGASRAWLAALEAINDRFARYLCAELMRDLRHAVEVTPPKAVRLAAPGEFARKLGLSNHLTLVGLRPLPGSMLVVVEAALVNWIVESRFGGNGRFPLAGKERGFSPFERQLFGRFVEQIAAQLVRAWQPIARLEPVIERQESASQPGAGAGERMLVSTFDVRIGQGGGRLTLCIPRGLLEPLRERLAGDTGPKPADPDPGWQNALAREVSRATLRLRVELVKLPMTLGEVLALRPGAILDIDRPESVTVEANATPLFRGRWGKHGRKIGIKVEENLQPAAGQPLVRAEPRGDHDDER
jgi:flagellar motor switch protein FliM